MIFTRFIPAKIKTFIIHRIVMSISKEIVQNWEMQNLIPLHQKIVRLEMEIKNLKKSLNK